MASDHEPRELYHYRLKQHEAPRTVRISGILWGLVLLAFLSLFWACTTEPTDLGHGEFGPGINLVASGAGLSDLTQPPYCAPNWFPGACWGMGLYATGNKQGDNNPPAITVPTPAAQVIVTMAMSNLLLIEDSLVPRVPNLVRCSAGGLSSYWLQGDTLTHSAGNPWDNCDAALAARGYSPADVALVLTIPGNSHPSGTIAGASNFGQFQNTAAKQVEAQLLGMGRTVKARYPGASIGYIGMAATHYHTSNFLPEPFSFEFGLATRWAIANQDATTAPMFWIAYNWDDTDPASYYQSDGVHPSAQGAGVRAEAIRQGLLASPFTAWFAGNPMPNAVGVYLSHTCGVGYCDFTVSVNGNQQTVRVSE